MNLFTIDKEKCTRCGNCATACPRCLIVLKAQGPDLPDFPLPTLDANEACIRCGHCVVVCPYGALTHKSMAVDQCSLIEEEKIPTSPQLEHFLKCRRSTRAFQDKPVERELLEKLIAIAQYAPSAHNSQPVHWLIFYHKQEVKRILEKIIAWARYIKKKAPEMAKATFMDRFLEEQTKGKDAFFKDAPHLIIAHVHKGDNTALSSCSIAFTYLELAAFSHGLGSCRDGYIIKAVEQWPPLKNALDIPADHAVYGAILLGYPKNKFHRVPLRNQPKITWR